MLSFTILVASAFATGLAQAESDAFNVLHHLGGNSPWFPGPETTEISSDIPSGCQVDLAAFFSRHGSRYPDLGAYNEWTNLSSRIHAANVSTHDSSLTFLSTWKPVLSSPNEQIARLSTTGYKELYDMGVEYRFRYPDLYDFGSNFTLWANYYSASPRVRDSARLFARGYLGPNATELGTIYALNSSDPRSFMNSLATSDLCPKYVDSGGSPQIDTWQQIYLPPIQKRLNDLINGSFQFTQSDVSIIPYLCGFESQIMGSKSPWCSVFTDDEILQYEYAQDLRYWYGNGLGTDIGKYMMLPVLDGLIQRFVDGPNATYNNSNNNGTAFTPPKLMAAFTNDGQINQLAAATSVFDKETQLPAERIQQDRLFKASNFDTMRGTISFERLSCTSKKKTDSISESGGVYLRIRLNDVVYAVPDCDSGPGRSCLLDEYQKLVKRKMEGAGDLRKLCNVTMPATPNNQSANFWTTSGLPFERVVKP